MHAHSVKLRRGHCAWRALLPHQYSHCSRHPPHRAGVAAQDGSDFRCANSLPGQTDQSSDLLLGPLLWLGCCHGGSDLKKSGEAVDPSLLRERRCFGPNRSVSPRHRTAPLCRWCAYDFDNCASLVGQFSELNDPKLAHLETGADNKPVSPLSESWVNPSPSHCEPTRPFQWVCLGLRLCSDE